MPSVLGEGDGRGWEGAGPLLAADTLREGSLEALRPVIPLLHPEITRVSLLCIIMMV